MSKMMKAFVMIFAFLAWLAVIVGVGTSVFKLGAFAMIVIITYMYIGVLLGVISERWINRKE